MKTVIIDNDKAIVNNNIIAEHIHKHDGSAFPGDRDLLTYLYKEKKMAYPKFYKMDMLCRLGFVGAELLLSSDIPDPRHAVVVIGHAGSMITDCNFQKTIADPADYFPSPAVFVYTLANIVTGEIAIRHKLQGESSSYLITEYNPHTITSLLMSALADEKIDRLTGGWIDCDINGTMSLRFVNIDKSATYNELYDFFNNNNISSWKN